MIIANFIHDVLEQEDFIMKRVDSILSYSTWWFDARSPDASVSTAWLYGAVSRWFYRVNLDQPFHLEPQMNFLSAVRHLVSV